MTDMDPENNQTTESMDLDDADRGTDHMHSSSEPTSGGHVQPNADERETSSTPSEAARAAASTQVQDERKPDEGDPFMLR